MRRTESFELEKALAATSGCRQTAAAGAVCGGAANDFKVEAIETAGPRSVRKAAPPCIDA